MSEFVWYRSLYWRIALGFVALLAALLLIQGLLFLWMTDRIVRPSSRSPVQLATAVASAVSAELARDPSIDLDDYVRRTFGHIYQPFLVVMHDGRMMSNRSSTLPVGFARSVQAAQRRAAPGLQPESRRAEIVPITVGETQLGFVAVPINPPPVFVALQELGPRLAWIAVGVLVVGAAVMALVIFRPAQRRLTNLQQVARALGDGRTDVRAVETGGDEVSSLARTFNKMADDLSARASALSASDRVRRQLLADVSHELMTPLSAIRGYTETLAMPELELDLATRRRYLSIVEDETHKLESMIGDLLDLARLEGGGGTLAFRDVKVSELFSRVTDRHGPAIRDAHIGVEAVVTPTDLAVRGDPDRLEQALQNLAANALRHTPSGGRLELRADERNGSAHIHVRDTGPGIPPEHLPHVFDRFYKVDAARSATAAPSGSGLGLSIVKAIVERHGGRIDASNAADGGAAFDLWLPRS
ncbi:MAG TPA: HAMP domain-containing sensor histidine kinase [Vicinamibacterales bacterium]|jgi:signal transduction histidine kinase|nr:HAMP domain-containing sensor histidine kinase [Vicinamibacterales bacterium]